MALMIDICIDHTDVCYGLVVCTCELFVFLEAETGENATGGRWL